MKRGLGILSFVLILVTAGCGKKGPPLPPLVRLPAPPGDFTAVRRGSTVALQFVVPSTNTDGSEPADLSRVDVYALTGLPTLTPDEILGHGTKVGSVNVNPPPDPDAPADEQAPGKDAAPRDGVDQGTATRLTDAVTPGINADTSDVRSYLAVGFNERGRRGAFSARVLVPLVPPPPAPGRPEVKWDESSITVTWSAAPAETETPLRYHVYTPGDVETRLTDRPLDDSEFVDRRIELGRERCYLVRAVGAAGDLTLESEASPTTCATPKDTFPPAAPVNLNVIAAEGAMNLIWDPNTEPDLAGYIVLRAIAPEPNPAPVNPSLLEAPTFKDTVPPGARVTYAVQAVDKAGNVSPMSSRVAEVAR